MKEKYGKFVGQVVLIFSVMDNSFCYRVENNDIQYAVSREVQLKILNNIFNNNNTINSSNVQFFKSKVI